MASIQYITGDLLDGDDVVIVHGCNAQGTMGSGIAGAIRKRWPNVYDVYREHYEVMGHRDILGEIIWAGGGEKVVGNAITQQFYGRDSTRRYCSYDAIATVMEKLDKFAAENEIKRIGLPLIGCGLANGSWKVVSQIIEVSAHHFTPMVYLLDGKVPA